LYAISAHYTGIEFTDDHQRKQARQRRDYLYRRALLLRDAEVSEKRAKLRAALASGKPLDPEIANDKQLRKDYDYDVSRDITQDDAADIDDEYSELSGVVGTYAPIAPYGA
jgi:U3 small nucleolar ribonucleoprotein protein IMP4